MKSFFLYIILFLYTASVLKPVLPAMVDLLAHTFQELEHTNTVHAHHGEEHVHLEMQSLVSEQPDDAPTPKIEFAVTAHLAPKVDLRILVPESAPAEWGRMVATLPDIYLLTLLRPPKRW